MSVEHGVEDTPDCCPTGHRTVGIGHDDQCPARLALAADAFDDDGRLGRLVAFAAAVYVALENYPGVKERAKTLARPALIDQALADLTAASPTEATARFVAAIRDTDTDPAGQRLPLHHECVAFLVDAGFAAAADALAQVA